MSAGRTSLPLAARVLDLLAVVLVLLAVTLALWGGFRTEIAGVRISMTTWGRPAVLALLLAALRHWRWPSPALPFIASRAVVGWWRSPAARAVWPIFLATRLGVLAVGLLAVVAIGYPSADGAPMRLYDSELANLPVRYDAGWYYDIAEHGYRIQTHRTDLQQNFAFFPAFPLAMRYVGLIVGRDPILAGMLISLGAFLWALVYFYRLSRQWLDDAGAATAVALLATYPFAVFYSAPYSESLFLLAIVGAWFHYGRAEWWQAALWGLLAGLTRPNGCFLSVPLGLMALAPLWREGRLQRPAAGWLSIADRLAVAATPGIGMLIYSAFVYDLTGDPLQWAKLHAAWGRTYVALPEFVSRQAETVANLGLYGVVATRTPEFLNATGVIFALATVWLVFRRLGVPAALLIVLTVLPPLASGGFLSMGRVTSTLFPCFVALAAAVPARHRTAWITGFAVFQAFNAVMFFTWRPVF
ncbi:MAG: mannosyltransferase family protein [Vicinamibacterales bacterium]